MCLGGWEEALNWNLPAQIHCLTPNPHGIQCAVNSKTWETGLSSEPADSSTFFQSYYKHFSLCHDPKNG